MKLLKISLRIIVSFLALLTIIFSVGAALCKFTDLPENSLIQIFGYVPFFWVLRLAVFVSILLLLMRNFYLTISYIAMMALFTLLLNDFSLNPLRHKSPESDGNYDNLKVAAYNVKYYSFGIENISNYIKSSDIDVLLLSESVLPSEKLDYLKNSLPAYSIITDGGHDLSILSKFPVISYKIIELPTFLASLSAGNDIDKLVQNGIHRSFIHAVINVNGTDVNLLSLRLIAGRPKNSSIKEDIKWGKYLMAAQNQELSVFLNYLNSLKGPFIIGGDLNTGPNSKIIHRIGNYMNDSYLDVHNHGSFTFKASFPTSRLDYIFHSNDLIVKDSRNVNCRLSDHFMVRADFLIPKTKQAFNLDDKGPAKK